ncbi:unnamed protein product [Effrenium voratum]|uniref:tRNA-uridine aminocarboxypropyltransferase n=1 Tax=Effrenium voratum TaxID=2562239 RepID=A0AA36I326_9DINO|nr:unnamed protein product [Effrenium voratum]
MEPVRWRKQRRQPEVQPPECLEEATGLVRYLAQSAAQRRNATLQQLLELPPQQRHAAMAELRARKVEEEMRAEGKCEKCMMQLKYCVCPSLETLRSDSVGAGTSAPLRFVVWMHHKERRRASNTGKLLKLLLPDVTDILIHGVAEDDRRLEEIIQNSGGHAFVVYPSDDAVPVSAALAKTGSDVAPVAVLIDGTWNQAQRMHKHFEHLLHVVVQPAGQSQFHWRRQSQEGRISTVEAAALLLEELPDTGLKPPEAPRALRQALAVLMEALGRQCHHDTLFQHDLPEPTGKKKFALGAKKIQKQLPGQRGIQS